MNRDYFDPPAAYEFYMNNYKKFGYSEKSLGWLKGKQNIRFEQLMKNFSISDAMRVFDIGCGFGDFNKWLKIKGCEQYFYKGVDLFDDFIETARTIYEGRKNISFVCDDFLKMQIDEKYDFVIASGIFNFKMEKKDNYENIRSVIRKALSICNTGVAFDFQSDKVDYVSGDIAFHNSPEKVLGIAYEFSRNIILDNSYMPFEFVVTIFKDDSYSKETTTFNKFREDNSHYYDAGVF